MQFTQLNLLSGILLVVGGSVKLVVGGSVKLVVGGLVKLIVGGSGKLVVGGSVKLDVAKKSEKVNYARKECTSLTHWLSLNMFTCNAH